MNIHVTWEVTLCQWTSSSQCFKGPQCVHLQGRAVQKEFFMNYASSNITLQPKGLILQQHCYENLIFPYTDSLSGLSTTIQYSEQNTFQRLGLFPSSAVQSNKQSCSQSLNPHCMYQNHTRQMTNAAAQTKLILHSLSLCHLNTVLQSPLELHVSSSYNRKDREPKKLLTDLTKE